MISLLRRTLFPKGSDSLDKLGMSIEDACSHILAIGGTGSGKTSVLKILLIDILRRGGRNVGCLWAGVKPDEVENFKKIIAAAGAKDRMMILTPGLFTYNFLAHEMSVGSPRTATQLLLDLNKIVSRSSGNSDESFWANLFEKMCSSAIAICWLAKRKGDGNDSSLTIEDVYKLISSSPANYEQAGSDAFKNSLCFQMLRLAERNIINDSDRRLYTQAATFFMAEAVSLGSKARGAAISQVSAVISPFLQSPLYETVACDESSFTPEMAITGSCVMMNASIMSCGIGGALFQSLLATQVTEAALRRATPTHMTLIVRDELQMLIGDANKEAMNLSVARSQKLSFVSGVQSIPTLQAAMGGNNAEQELHSLLANYSTKMILSNPCSKTNKYFSEAWGDSLQEFVSVSESKEEEPLDLLNMLTGNDRLLFSVSTQLTPRCPVDAFHSLRRGGKANRLCVDFFLTQAGRTYGPDYSPYKLVTFKQV